MALESTETEMVWGERSGLLAKEGGRLSSLDHSACPLLTLPGASCPHPSHPTISKQHMTQQRAGGASVG